MNIENTEQLIDLIEDKAYPPLSKSTIDGLKTGDASTYGSLAFLEHAEALVRQHYNNPVIQQFVKRTAMLSMQTPLNTQNMLHSGVTNLLILRHNSQTVSHGHLPSTWKTHAV